MSDILDADTAEAPTLSLDQRKAIAIASARKRAVEAKAGDAAPAQPNDPGAASTFLSEMNRTLLAPIDALSPRGALGSLFLTPSARAKAQALPKPSEPFVLSGEPAEGYVASAGRGTGNALLFALPASGAGAAKAAHHAITSVAPTTLGGRILESIGQLPLRYPATSLSVESALGAASGAGGEAGAEGARAFPEVGISEDAGRVIGETAGGLGIPALVGGTAGTARGLWHGGSWLAEKLPTSSWVIDQIRGQLKSGATRRAEDRVKRALHDPESAVRTMREKGAVIDEAIPGPDDVPGVPGTLSPAQLSADRGALSLERSVVESTGRLKDTSDKQIAGVNEKIHTALRDLATGDGAGAINAETERATKDYLLDLLDANARVALKLAEEKIATLGPNIPREEINRLGRVEIEAAAKAGRAQESELWNAIPRETRVSFSQTRGKYAELVKDTPLAQQMDIPEIARRFLDPGSPSFIKSPNNTAHELIGIRNALLEESRAASAAGSPNRARLAGDLANSILDDLGAEANATRGPVGHSYRIAVDFSKKFNDLFTRGPVGALRGFAATGEAEVAPGLTFESTIGRGGPIAREAVDAMLAASEGVGGDSAGVSRNIENYLREIFTKAALRNGNVARGPAETWLRRFDEPLSRLPDLRDELAQIVRLGTQVAPRKAIKEVLESPAAGGAMKKLISQSASGDTGLNKRTIRTGLIDHVLTGADSGKFDISGAPILSGREMVGRLNNPRVAAAMREAMTAQQIVRLRQIAETARRIEMAIEAGQSPEGIIQTAPNVIVETIARVAASQIGRHIAQQTGGGTVQTPGIISGRTKELLHQFVKDPAARLVVDAVHDPELFAALATRTSLPAAVARKGRIINAWAAGVIRDAVDAESASEEGDRK